MPLSTPPNRRRWLILETVLAAQPPSAADTRLGKAFRIGQSYITPSQSLEGRSSRDWFAEVVAERAADRLLEEW